MQYEIPIERYCPEIVEFLREFERKSRATNLIVKNKIKLVDGMDINNLPSVYFFDPKNPDQEAGYVSYNRGEKIWTVRSRLIENNKYRQWSGDHRKKTTNDIKKALKIALQFVVPYTYREIAQRELEENDNVRHQVKDWYNKSLSQARRLFDSINRDVLMKEITALKSMGVQFQTPEFNNFADEGIALYAEHEERKKFTTLFHFVQEVEGDRYAVCTTTNHDNSGWPKEFDKDATVYNTFEAVPEHIRSMVAMLRMLDTKATIPEEGVRLSTNQFVVLDRIAKTEIV